LADLDGFLFFKKRLRQAIIKVIVTLSTKE